MDAIPDPALPRPAAGAVANSVLLYATREGWPAQHGYDHQLPVVRRVSLREREQPFMA